MSTTDTTRVTAELLPETSAAPICERVESLMRQLADAVAEWHDLAGHPHTFIAQVPSSKSGEPVFMLNQPWRAEDAEMRLKHHAKEFAKAAKEIDPTATELWIGRAVDSIPGGARFSAIVQTERGR